MARVSEERSLEIERAAERARAVLKPGDRLLVATCGDSRGSTVTMTGWCEDFPGFIQTKTFDADEIHPFNVRKVNGVPTSFRDPVLKEDSHDR